MNITPAVRTSADHVGDDPGQRRGERLLGADHVVVEPADQRAGLGAGEEGQRHPLHVVEHLGAQVEDQALADAGRVPALGQRQQRRRARPGPAITTAIWITTVAGAPCGLITLTTRPASTGVATPITALAITVSRKTVSSRRYGRAKPAIRRAVPWAASARPPTGRAGTSASRSTARGHPASSSLAPPAGTKPAGCRALPPLRPRRNRRAAVTSRPVRPARRRTELRSASCGRRGRARRRSWAARSAASCVVPVAVERAEQQGLGLGDRVRRRRQQRGDQVGDGGGQLGPRHDDAWPARSRAPRPRRPAGAVRQISSARG